MQKRAKKLHLSKETLQRLEEVDLSAVPGAAPSYQSNCFTCVCPSQIVTHCCPSQLTNC